MPDHAAKAAAELEKIERLIGIAADQWDDDPTHVRSREFFIDWELAAFPEPFLVDEQIALAGQTLLPSREGMLATIVWHHEDQQPAFVLEHDEVRQHWLIEFTEEDPVFHEQPAELFEKQEISYGERLEFIFDLISWCGRHRPSWVAHRLTREQYLTALREIADTFPKAVVSLMRRMTMRNVHKLIATAARDMADDELSNQLTLPLDGTYAVSGNSGAATAGLPATRVAARTPASVLRALRFLQRVVATVAAADEAIRFPLDDAEVLDDRGFVWTLRTPLPDSCGDLAEGARMPVVAPGDRRPCARLTIDVRERTHAVASLRWDGPPDLHPRELPTAGLVAEAPRSPHRFVRDELQALQQHYFRTGQTASPAIAAALGLIEQSFPATPIENPPPRLDPAQQTAWAATVHDPRTIALVQGPPGTGKTHVLEQTLRTLVANGKRILLIAPSHAAVDNVCRRILDLPILRISRNTDKLHPDVAGHWVENPEAVQCFVNRRQQQTGTVYAGTPLGILRAPLVEAELEQLKHFDVLVLDEAGMAPVAEFLLCARLARRAVLFGDHQQLPPFPLTPAVEADVRNQTLAPPGDWLMVRRSALEWLAETRRLPVTMLRTSYRCHNPRLIRFSSVLFYDAAVRSSAAADYFTLSWDERQKTFPPATLRLYDTSKLKPEFRHETLSLENGRPGIENQLEAAFCCGLVYRLLRRLPLAEISVIAPYRRQVRLIRDLLSSGKAAATAATPFSDAEWDQFVHSRVATVDSFQGSEADATVICYVRSNADGFIGFVDDPNRINVAHSRCRRELHVVGDLDCLIGGDRGNVFARLKRTIQRDGELIDLTDDLAAQLLARINQ